MLRSEPKDHCKDVIPGANQSWSLPDAPVSGRLTEPVEPVAQVAHETMLVTHHLCAGESLEATHATRASFEMLVLAPQRPVTPFCP